MRRIERGLSEIMAENEEFERKIRPKSKGKKKRKEKKKSLIGGVN